MQFCDTYCFTFVTQIGHQIFSMSTQRLLEACSVADLSKVTSLLDQGADPNAQDDFGFSCLHKVAQIPDESKPISQIIDILIKKGARTRHSALHCSATPQAVRALLTFGADVNAQTTDGKSALTSALALGREDVALELLRAGASFDSALLLKARSPSLARELLVRGADPNVPDASGASPLQLAVDRGDRALARVLLEFRADATKVVPRQSSSDPEPSVSCPPVVVAAVIAPVVVTPVGARSTTADALSGLLTFLGDFEKRLSPESFSSIELGAIEGALEVVLRKVRALRS